MNSRRRAGSTPQNRLHAPMTNTAVRSANTGKYIDNLEHNRYVQAQGCVRSENISAERFFTERLDQTAPLREICSGGYPIRDNP